MSRLIGRGVSLVGLFLLACSPDRPSLGQDPPRPEEVASARVGTSASPSTSPGIPAAVPLPTVQVPRLDDKMPSSNEPGVRKPAPSVERGTLAQVFPVLSALPRARTLTFAEVWSGIPGSRRALYALARNGDHFEGHASWRSGVVAGRGDAYERRHEFDFEVPADVVERYLTSLGQLTVAEGQALGYWDHTDDYPASEYRVGTNDGDLSIYTTSQHSWLTKEERRPWAVEFRGTRMVIDNTGPVQAFDIMAPYLKWDDFLEFHQQFMREVIAARASPSPSPSPSRTRR